MKDKIRSEKNAPPSLQAPSLFQRAISFVTEQLGIPTDNYTLFDR